MLECYCSEHRGTYLYLSEPGFFNLSTIHAQHPCRIEFHFTVGRRASSEIMIRFTLLGGLQSESFFPRNVRKILPRSPSRKTSDFSEWVLQEYEGISSQNARSGHHSCRENLKLLLNCAKYCSQHGKKCLFILPDLSLLRECKRKCLASRIEVLREAYKRNPIPFCHRFLAIRWEINTLSLEEDHVNPLLMVSGVFMRP